MEEVLTQIGLTAKEARLYMLMLEHGTQTAAELAKQTGEKRANTYALLDSLVEKRVVLFEDNPIRKYSVADPMNLQKLLHAQQDRYKQATAALQAALPRIKSQYSLTTNKPGVVHISGPDGFLLLLDDMVRSRTEVLLVAGNDVPKDAGTLQAFRSRQDKRKEAGVKTRAIFHEDDMSAVRKKEFSERGIELRFLGHKQFRGEVVLYEDNTVFTVYDPSLLVTILTNQHITDTMRTIFEELWAKAKG